MYSPFDFNQSIAHRAEYVEERLKSGSPVVGISYDGGVLLWTVKRTQRKLFEIYDQIMYGAIGNQADVEAVRLASIDFSHQEGFTRSPDDVSLQRLVGFTLSPPLKRNFGDPMTTPTVMRAVFAEVGRSPERDQFFVLSYDGEFTTHSGTAVVGPSASAEDAMAEHLKAQEGTPDLKRALELARETWIIGRREKGDEDDASDPLQELLDDGGSIEAAILERSTPRESKFRLLSNDELN